MIYNSKIKNRKNEVDTVVLNGVLSILEKNGSWVGTMTNLTTQLKRELGKKQAKMLPASPGALRVVLNRIVNKIRNRSVSVRFIRANDQIRTRFVKFVA